MFAAKVVQSSHMQSNDTDRCAATGKIVGTGKFVIELALVGQTRDFIAELPGFQQLLFFVETALNMADLYEVRRPRL